MRKFPHPQLTHIIYNMKQPSYIIYQALNIKGRIKSTRSQHYSTYFHQFLHNKSHTCHKQLNPTIRTPKQPYTIRFHREENYPYLVWRISKWSLLFHESNASYGNEIGWVKWKIIKLKVYVNGGTRKWRRRGRFRFAKKREDEEREKWNWYIYVILKIQSQSQLHICLHLIGWWLVTHQDKWPHFYGCQVVDFHWFLCLVSRANTPVSGSQVSLAYRVPFSKHR